MNETASNNQTSTSKISRRRLIQGGIVGGGAAWAAPTVFSMTSVAAAASFPQGSCNNSRLSDCGPNHCPDGVSLAFGGATCFGGCVYVQIWGHSGGNGCICAHNNGGQACGPGQPGCPPNTVCTPYCPDTPTSPCGFYCASTVCVS